MVVHISHLLDEDQVIIQCAGLLRHLNGQRCGQCLDGTFLMYRHLSYMKRSINNSDKCHYLSAHTIQVEMLQIYTLPSVVLLS